MDALERAIKMVGGPAAFARCLDVSPQRVNNWRQRRAPGEHVLAIVRATGGQVTPHDLRPDLYPDPEWLPSDVRPDQKDAA